LWLDDLNGSGDIVCKQALVMRDHSPFTGRLPGRAVLVTPIAAAALILALCVGTGRADARPASSDWCQHSLLWRDAKAHVGERVRVRGRIRSIKTVSTAGRNPTFLGVGRAYPSPSRVAVVVLNDGSENDMPVPWPDDASYLLGKRQCFEGRVNLVRGVPTIRITHFDFVDGVFVE
jgi:hypothetical protein